MSSWGASAGFDRPFIGVRPFEYSDRKYFFGRDDELEVLERKLKQNRFVAVVGRSGCGKSSLISAGLRPRFEKVADHRCWIEICPGEAPIRELAVGLVSLLGETGDLSEAWADRFERVLTKSSFGLGGALALICARPERKGSRVLLFVDQFEELLRFADARTKRKFGSVAATERREEATKFVRLLLTAMKSPRLPIDIIVSIRSDFIGDCARFHGLPEAVSRSQFLVPDMTRDQREDVIRKPIQLVGGQIDPALVQRALNDTNDDPDQLPNLQRAMMRCWERALHRGKQEADRRLRLTIDDYTKSAAAA
jgi:energy-coupling factor transporter ATP-binding protein EcfA2